MGRTCRVELFFLNAKKTILIWSSRRKDRLGSDHLPTLVDTHNVLNSVSLSKQKINDIDKISKIRQSQKRKSALLNKNFD